MCEAAVYRRVVYVILRYEHRVIDAASVHSVKVKK